MFSAENLEWEFISEGERKRAEFRKLLEFSNGNKNVKNISNSGQNWSNPRTDFGEFNPNVKIRLKNKEINREYSVMIKNEIKDDSRLKIGVVDRLWTKSICYFHKQGAIDDYGYEIKKLKEKLNRSDFFVIKDTCVGKINDKNVYKVSMHKNQEELFKTLYCQKEKSQLFLDIGRQIQLEVDVKGKI